MGALSLDGKVGACRTIRQGIHPAGVNIDEAQRALRSVKEAVTATHGEEVLDGIGGFGGMFAANFPQTKRPVLVSSIDGVGTKTTVAMMTGDFSNIGRDIVNHCVNDVLCQGAKPLFFLDYFGCSKLNSTVFRQVVESAADACKEVGCALIGGETAEMPGVYREYETDIVGCIVGMVDAPADRLPRTTVQVGDVLVGLGSVGLHTNGFSLARKVLFEKARFAATDSLPGTNDTVAGALLKPHKCYYNAFSAILVDEDLHALAHITGGGLYDNLARVLPDSIDASLQKSSWEVPPIFSAIQSAGQIEDAEMHRAFNMGVGMVAVVARGSEDRVVGHLRAAGETAMVIGELTAGTGNVQIA